MRTSSRIAVALAFLVPGAAMAAGLNNPLGSVNIPTIIGNVIKAILGLSGAVSLLVFVWSGTLMILSAGNADKIKQAKSSLVWASIGLVVIFTAYTLVATLISVLSTASGT